MPTITVPSGSGGASVSLTFASNASASLATSLLSSVYAAALTSPSTLVVYPAGPASGNAVNEYVIAPTVTGSVTVPSGYAAVIDAATGPVTITGNGNTNESVVASGGGTTYIAQAGGTGTFIAGGGNNTFVDNSSTTGGYTIEGDGSDTSFLVTGTVNTGLAVLQGAATVTAGGSGVFVFGSGGTNSNMITNVGTGTDVVVNAGATTVNAQGPAGLYFDLSGTLLFANASTSTVVASAGSGAATFFGGNSNGAYFQGSDTSFFEFVNGSSNSSVVAGPAGGVLAFDSAGGTINLYGSSSSAFNYLVGGTGAETLNAAFSSGTAVLIAGASNATAYMSNTSTDAVFAGTGSSTIVGGTTTGGAALPDLYAFVNGSSGGSDLIINWGPASGLVFLGYGAAGDAAIKSAIAASSTSSNAVAITLPDNTKITVLGVSGSTVNLNNNPAFYS